MKRIIATLGSKEWDLFCKAQCRSCCLAENSEDSIGPGQAGYTTVALSVPLSSLWLVTFNNFGEKRKFREHKVYEENIMAVLQRNISAQRQN